MGCFFLMQRIGLFKSGPACVMADLSVCIHLQPSNKWIQTRQNESHPLWAKVNYLQESWFLKLCKDSKREVVCNVIIDSIISPRYYPVVIDADNGSDSIFHRYSFSSVREPCDFAITSPACPKTHRWTCCQTLNWKRCARKRLLLTWLINSSSAAHNAKNL